MTPEMVDLARRAKACKGWRWMRGMSNDKGQTIDCVDLIPGWAYCGEVDADMNALPDLTDDATLGCLLALVRAAWNCPTLYVEHEHVGMDRCDPRRPYHVCCGDGTHINGIWRTEAEALVAALEAAP